MTNAPANRTDEGGGGKGCFFYSFTALCSVYCPRSVKEPHRVQVKNDARSANATINVGFSTGNRFRKNGNDAPADV